MKKIIMTMLVISIHLCCVHGLSPSQRALSESPSQSALPKSPSQSAPLEEDDATVLVGRARLLSVDKEGNTRFHHLAEEEHSTDDLAAIFENYSADTFTLCLKAKNDAGKTALHIAAENRNHVFILAVIIGYAASLKRSEEHSEDLRRMYDEHSSTYMYRVIDELSQPFLVSDNKGNNFMHLAAQRGDGFYGAVSSSLGECVETETGNYCWIKNGDKTTAEDRAIERVIRAIDRELGKAKNNAGQTPNDILIKAQSKSCLLL